MAITNKIKLIVFGQYLGQVAQWKNLDYTDKYETEIMWDNIQFFIDNKAYLFLKPLSEITDDDAIEVYNIVKDVELLDKAKREHILSWFKNKTNGYLVNDWDITLQAFQFLQSKGYDLPQYLLGGKTLQEVGLAIYE
jgi:hypothetical protein